MKNNSEGLKSQHGDGEGCRPLVMPSDMDLISEIVALR
jgi:hypothetical protein